MPARFIIQRVKRYTSREERERHPDWLNPSELRRDDDADLVELVNTRHEACPNASAIEAYAKAGGELFLVRDAENRRKSLHGKIVAMAAYAIVPTFTGRAGIVSGVYLHPDEPSIASYMQEAITRHFALIGIELLRHAEIPRRPIKSDISGIDRAERYESILDVPTSDDGPPTQKLGLSAGRAKC